MKRSDFNSFCALKEVRGIAFDFGSAGHAAAGCEAGCAEGFRSLAAGFAAAGEPFKAVTFLGAMEGVRSSSIPMIRPSSSFSRLKSPSDSQNLKGF